MTKKKNPVLEKKWHEGFEAGRKQGIQDSINYFTKRLMDLEQVPGIGKKTMQKIVDQLGEEYFQMKRKRNKDF
ncbi:hypothetical protein J416_09424 [Gracilibacillus halophilus YIM-C55.5]|uniref:Uncharacterized protein n=1 Tax=Gracilibacillus halophilus YIM-C55.5 TaxID=1308866 RepID=N4WKL8_9BACI|nr:helix-hairpin-helix domain-containing protein [Gracilibacillus halophilus]ENH96707.1 hypothetical protein J416_09424 [Gracilibacillus halophilus YIM-C55.5]